MIVILAIIILAGSIAAACIWLERIDRKEQKALKELLKQSEGFGVPALEAAVFLVPLEEELKKQKS